MWIEWAEKLEFEMGATLICFVQWVNESEREFFMGIYEGKMLHFW